MLKGAHEVAVAHALCELQRRPSWSIVLQDRVTAHVSYRSTSLSARVKLSLTQAID